MVIELQQRPPSGQDKFDMNEPERKAFIAGANWQLTQLKNEK